MAAFVVDKLHRRDRHVEGLRAGKLLNDLVASSQASEQLDLSVSKPEACVRRRLGALRELAVPVELAPELDHKQPTVLLVQGKREEEAVAVSAKEKQTSRRSNDPPPSRDFYTTLPSRPCSRAASLTSHPHDPPPSLTTRNNSSK